MRTKIIYIALAFITIALGVNAQVNNFKSLSMIQKKQYLLSKSKEIVQTFGKEYYQNSIEPSVTIYKYDAGSGGDSTMKYFTGKEYYEITAHYDKNKEQFEMEYLYKVWIWKENGIPFAVFFGNGAGLNFFDVPYEELAKCADEYQIQFERIE